MENKKHTYQEWWDGKVYLETCPIYYSNGDDLRIKCGLADFNDNDVIKIRNKQKELFEEQCSKLLGIFKNTFTEGFRNSEEKQYYFKCEVEDLRRILTSRPIPEISYFLNRDFSMSSVRLSHMRRYIVEQIVRGKKYYGFVHSPNYPFQNKSIPDEVYARVCWEYSKWIKDFAETLKKSESKAGINPVKKVSGTEKLGIPVIALIHFYKGPAITRVNADKIAAEYNYTSKKSGEGLFQDYAKYSNKENRLGLNEESRKPNATKLIHIETAIKHLNGKAKKHAESDYKTLHDLINKTQW